MRDKLIELLDETFEKQANRNLVIAAIPTADYLIANGVTMQQSILPDIEKLQKQIKALEKSNRNWRRKCQRLRNLIETTENET